MSEPAIKARGGDGCTLAHPLLKVCTECVREAAKAPVPDLEPVHLVRCRCGRCNHHCAIGHIHKQVKQVTSGYCRTCGQQRVDCLCWAWPLAALFTLAVVGGVALFAWVLK